jgi:hypothetical protein
MNIFRSSIDTEAAVKTSINIIFLLNISDMATTIRSADSGNGISQILKVVRHNDSLALE